MAPNNKGKSKPSPSTVPRRSTRRQEARAMNIQSEQTQGVTATNESNPVGEASHSDEPVPKRAKVSSKQRGNSKKTSQTVPDSSDVPTRKEFDELKTLLIAMSDKINTISNVNTTSDNSKSDNQNDVVVANTGNSQAVSNLLPTHNEGDQEMQILDVRQMHPDDDEVEVEPNSGGGIVNENLSNDNVQASRQINQLVEQHISNLMNTNQQTGLEGEDHFISAKRPIDSKISSKVKNQIWANEFVDLGTLLVPKVANTSIKQKRTFELISDKNDYVALKPTKETNVIQTIEQWSDAFLVYLSIYCEKYPEHLKSMTTYMNMIKILHNRKGDYIWYDQEFRYGRSLQGGGWAMDSELWIMACGNTTNPNEARTSPGLGGQLFRPSVKSGSSNKGRHPKGYCFRYHSKGDCNRSPCPFKHNCYTEGCGAVHPVFKCRKRLSAHNKSGSAPQSSNANSK